jgi:hypothetical protein
VNGYSDASLAAVEAEERGTAAVRHADVPGLDYLGDRHRGRERRGAESARHAKIVLSGMFGLAVRHDAFDASA